MSRARRLQRVSSASSSSSGSSSPEREVEDDNDSFTLQANDSQSSLGADLTHELSNDAAFRREYEERCRVSPVHRLPAELLISIFSRLTSPHDLQMCMLVSKDWARNSVGLLWHRPAMSKWESIHIVIQSIRKSKKFFAYQDLVKRLNMSTLSVQVSDGTLSGMIECKRIERLTLTNCSKLTDISLQPLINGNRSLLALDITGLDQVTDQTMITVADNCLRLQGLNVTGCKKITDASIAAIARNCRHLKRLKFNNCPQLTDLSILTVAAHSTSLLEIDLYGLQNIESPSITALLTSCKQLRELRLAHCSRITDYAFLDIAHDPELPFNFEALRILDLTDCGELGDKGVERIIQLCPRLRNLILAKCRQITDRAVFAITKLGKNLHYIHLGHCARITDQSIEALAKACNRIRYIDLACCSNLTDNSVMKLAGLPKLKRIGLVKCAGITDRSIHSLAQGERKALGKSHSANVLERVHLSYCTLLTLDGIHVLLNKCPNLTHLSLTGVQAFLREELLTFCREAPPEFNEHQRDVFCVFSGSGVTRLRNYLNTPKQLPDALPNPGAPNDVGIATGVDDDSSHHGFGTPVHVIDIDVESSHPPGSTPTISTPGPAPEHMHPGHPPPPPHLGPFNVPSQGGGSSYNQPYNQPIPPPHHPYHPHYHQHWGNVLPQQISQFDYLSQSAPAFQNVTWANPVAAVTSHVGGSAHSAQHVTGMMGAAHLDEVDGDETFGEDSEIM